MAYFTHLLIMQLVYWYHMYYFIIIIRCTSLSLLRNTVHVWHSTFSASYLFLFRAQTKFAETYTRLNSADTSVAIASDAILEPVASLGVMTARTDLDADDVITKLFQACATKLDRPRIKQVCAGPYSICYIAPVSSQGAAV